MTEKGNPRSPSRLTAPTSSTTSNNSTQRGVRDMRRRCAAAGVAFFYKQSAAPRTETGMRNGVIS